MATTKRPTRDDRIIKYVRKIYNNTPEIYPIMITLDPIEWDTEEHLIELLENYEYMIKLTIMTLTKNENQNWVKFK